MKKIYLPIIIVIFLLIHAVKGQNLIAVQNSSGSTFYAQLDDAITNAQNGDTIFIPGGSFINPIVISKRLHLVGVGHNPDSTNATPRTLIPSVQLYSGADNGSITGINCGIRIIEFIEGYTISRCSLNYFNNPFETSNFSIMENIITDRMVLYGGNSFISNNIFRGQLSAHTSNVQNNVFLFYNDNSYYYPCFSGYDCVIKNNIFSQNVSLGAYNIYFNNVNMGINGNDEYFNQGNNNHIDNVALQSIFISYDIATYTGYNADFHLPVGSPYKNAGRDGTDIGIYGGAFPWKDGSIPFNPHFQNISVAPQTDSSGNLNVNIKVGAQE